MNWARNCCGVPLLPRRTWRSPVFIRIKRNDGSISSSEKAGPITRRACSTITGSKSPGGDPFFDGQSRLTRRLPQPGMTGASACGNSGRMRMLSRASTGPARLNRRTRSSSSPVQRCSRGSESSGAEERHCRCGEDIQQGARDQPEPCGCMERACRLHERDRERMNVSHRQYYERAQNAFAKAPPKQNIDINC